ncbi:MAG: ComF family protein [Candidatus Berkelbacteria bacterium]
MKILKNTITSQRLSDALLNIRQVLLNIFYPKLCVSCGKYGQYLCAGCAGEIELLKTPTCFYCGKISPNGKSCLNCRARMKTDLFAIIPAVRYDIGPMKEIIHQLKYCGVSELAEILAELIFQKIKNLDFGKNIIIVPVPLNIKKKNIRGYNQAELLAKYLSDRLECDFADILVRCRNTASQTTLHRRERLLNLKSAFRCIDSNIIRGKTVLLIDDVATTGATLSECSNVLKESCAKKVIGVVAARNILK